MKKPKTKANNPKRQRRFAALTGSDPARNLISGEKSPLPRIMWADHDPDDKRTPVVVYPSKSEQHGNRPELKAIPVAVIELDRSYAEMTNDFHYAILARRERTKRGPNVKPSGGRPQVTPPAISGSQDAQGRPLR